LSLRHDESEPESRFGRLLDHDLMGVMTAHDSALPDDVDALQAMVRAMAEKTALLEQRNGFASVKWRAVW
jgi:hypothetical protein